MSKPKVDKALREYSDYQNDMVKVITCAIMWQKVMSYELDPKAGTKDYYEKRDALETRAFNELFEAVEKYRENNNL